ncbi:unnamed protein product [Linum trigynum]|uniref:Uncharacterized protein n=1 Tax=Linum trigynum TaxID=586398 RepID=A0AAV2E681_9ROSI
MSYVSPIIASSSTAIAPTSPLVTLAAMKDVKIVLQPRPLALRVVTAEMSVPTASIVVVIGPPPPKIETFSSSFERLQSNIVDAEIPILSMTRVSSLSIDSGAAVSSASNNKEIAYRVAGEMIPREAGLKDVKEQQIISIRFDVSRKFRRKRELEDGGQERNGGEGSREEDGFCKRAVVGSNFAGLGAADEPTIQGCVWLTMGGLTGGLLYGVKPNSKAISHRSHQLQPPGSGPIAMDFYMKKAIVEAAKRA